ncbi:DUF4833 domain-containing protein [Pedobacter sp. HMWF019]|uniref:DUF4833 domain-containing protein n=1 Tax=Pedobacter sp. HMWF019 TaxID=2056856 RepID=UPI001304BA46|nr:DUF4833 domain-containing protein [Pedobacter sp. HMWF019]
MLSRAEKKEKKVIRFTSVCTGYLLMKLILFCTVNRDKLYRKKRTLQNRNAWEEIIKIIGLTLLMCTSIVEQAYPKELRKSIIETDACTIIYELNYNADGTLCSKEPVKSSLTRYSDTGKRRALSPAERKYAYGLLTRPIGNDEYEIRLIAYKQLPLYLKKSVTDHQYRIYIKDQGQDHLLKRVFVSMDEHFRWFPMIRYIDLIPIQNSNGKEILQRINI